MPFAGIPIFLANMAFAGWIKFSPRLGFQAGTPIIITALMGLGTVYFLLSHGRWASHILTQAPQVSLPNGPAVRAAARLQSDVHALAPHMMRLLAVRGIAQMISASVRLLGSH